MVSFWLPMWCSAHQGVTISLRLWIKRISWGVRVLSILVCLLLTVLLLCELTQRMSV